MYGLRELTAKLKWISSKFSGSRFGVLHQVLEYLKWGISKLFRYRCINWLIVIAIFILSIYYIPTLNWNASAIGRLVLIKWILPYYDWQHLYNSRCLVDKFRPDTQSEASSSKDYGGSDGDECAICENLGNF